MANIPSGSRTGQKRIAWITGLLCAACCAVPVAALVLGSASLAALAVYPDKVAIAVLAAGLTLLAYAHYRRNKNPSCDLDCSFRPEPDPTKLK